MYQQIIFLIPLPFPIKNAFEECRLILQHPVHFSFNFPILRFGVDKYA